MRPFGRACRRPAEMIEGAFRKLREGLYPVGRERRDPLLVVAEGVKTKNQFTAWNMPIAPLYARAMA